MPDRSTTPTPPSCRWGPELALSSTTLVELWQRALARTPAAVALGDGRQTLSYDELDQRSGRLAQLLRAEGVGDGCPVGLALPRSVEQFVSLLAILKAGGAYLPLDPAYPPARLELIVDDAQPTLIIGQLPGREGVGVPWQELDERASTLTPLAPIAVSSESPACLLYTSGSTGRPKGVVIPHRALANIAAEGVYALDPGPADVFLLQTTLNFDLHAFEIYPAWAAGARVELAPLDLWESIERFVEVLAERSISVVMLTTHLWHEWVRSGPSCCPPATLRAVSVCGERMRSDMVAGWFALGNQRILARNAYGPTEAAVYASARVLAPVDGQGEVPIGRPIPNSRLYVLDEELNPLPWGEVGEICIAGAGVANGYLNRPSLTADRFRPDPFGPGLLYRTGDRGRYRDDGELEFLGRFDHQLKVRGYRIEPGEIERALRSHPALSEAIVIGHEDEDGEKRLIAYLAGPSHLPRVAELRGHLRGLLPDYMLPDLFIGLERMPTTANGKLDRAALPAPSSDLRLR